MSNTIPPLKFFPWSEINEHLYHEREESSFVDWEAKGGDFALDWFTPFSIVFTTEGWKLLGKQWEKENKYSSIKKKPLILWQLVDEKPAKQTQTGQHCDQNGKCSHHKNTSPVPDAGIVIVNLFLHQERGTSGQDFGKAISWKNENQLATKQAAVLILRGQEVNMNSL